MSPFRTDQRWSFGLLGGGSGVPRDVILLLAIVFATFSLQFFSSTAIVPAVLRLTPAVWRLGFLWQLVTYPFAGVGAPSLWFLLELFILFIFARDVFARLGRRRFWTLLVAISGVAGLVATLAALVEGTVAALPAATFALMQGQHTLLVVMVAAFATLNREATIYLFFVLPVRARWFLWLEVLFAFMGFLGSRDLAGFLGLCAAVGASYLALRSGSLRWRGLARETRLRAEHWWLRQRLTRLRRKRGFRIVRDEEERGDPWLH